METQIIYLILKEISAIKIIIKHQRMTVDELKSENLNERHKIKF